MSIDALVTHATEQGTYVITAAFTDDDGAAVVPNSITWTLLDTDEEVVNGREDEEVTPAASSIEIVLQGDDLTPGRKTLLIEATYDSDAGSGLPLKKAVYIAVDDLPGVS